MREITDGTSNTILVIEAGKDNPVHWMEPSDAYANYFLVRDPQKTAFNGGFHVLLSDCSVRFLMNDVSQRVYARR